MKYLVGALEPQFSLITFVVNLSSKVFAQIDQKKVQIHFVRKLTQVSNPGPSSFSPVEFHVKGWMILKKLLRILWKTEHGENLYPTKYSTLSKTQMII